MSQISKGQILKLEFHRIQKKIWGNQHIKGNSASLFLVGSQMRYKVNSGNDVNEKQLREICSTCCHNAMSELVGVDDTTVNRRQSSGLSSTQFHYHTCLNSISRIRNIYLLIYHPFKPFMQVNIIHHPFKPFMYR